MRPIVRLIRWLVAKATSAPDRAMLLADLDDEFAGRQNEEGRARAMRWLLSQALRSCAAQLRYRLSWTRGPGRAHGRFRSLFSWQDLRCDARGLKRTPAFTVVASATLAVGIGASTAAFTAFKTALLAPLPFPNERRLAVIVETRHGEEYSDAYPNFLDWQARSRWFEAMASFRGLTVTVTGNGTPERIRGQIVNANLFEVLGVPPMLGRGFGADLDRRGAATAVVLGYGLWHRRYNDDGGIVGRTITIDGSPREVLGIMPRYFDFPSGISYPPADVYLSFGAYWDDDIDNRRSHPGLETIGLLRPGVTRAAAQVEMSGIAAQLAREHPDTNKDADADVRDPVLTIVGDLRGQLHLLLAASLTLLLIACVNVAGLTLTRTIARRRELAVRTALGASRVRLAAALLIEHTLLAAIGSAAGVGLAYLLTSAIRPLLLDLPRIAALSPDRTALVFAAAAMTTTSLLFSVAPLWWLRRASMDPWLRQRGQTGHGLRARQIFVGAQLALALTLVVAGALLADSFVRRQSRSGGIAADGVLTFGMRLPEASYQMDGVIPFYDELYRRLRAGPGVAAVGGISTLPFSGSFAQAGFRVRGRTDMESIRTDVAVVTPGYFRAMGITLVRGRLIDEHDTATSRQVAVVDERFATRMFPNGDVLGGRVDGWSAKDITIVGVVGNVENAGVGAGGRQELYVPLTQRPRPMFTTVVRASGDPAALTAAARAAIAALDPELAISNVRTMRQWVDQTLAGPKLLTTLSGGFGLVALLLAAIGVSGLTGYAVELRRREAGIRLALGATPRRVIALMIGGMAGALIAGAAAGLAGAILAGRLIGHQLFELRASDPTVLASATATLLAVALVAGWMPARRAARVELSSILQEE